MASGRWLDGSVVGGSVIGGFNKTLLVRSSISACAQNHTKLAATIINLVTLVIDTVLYSLQGFSRSTDSIKSKTDTGNIT